MNEHGDLGNLDNESWNKLQDIVERFESDCAKSFPRDILEYVPQTDEKIRDIVLSELVRTDLELRWRKRQGVLIEFYLKDFPDLLKSEFLPKLLKDEMDVRLQHAARPEMAEYQQRFPERFEEFSTLVAAPSRDSRVAPPLLSTPIKSDFVVPVEKDSLSDTMSGVFAMAARFKRVRKLGEGAFGEVWEAQGPGGVPVAIKRIFGTVSTKAVERERESLDLICSGKLRHPFLLQVFGWWINNGRLHIMMELADESLEDRLKASMRDKKTGLPFSELKQILVDTADALDFLNHERNIVHRDVKPANMLLMANRLKLCDFGLSRMSENLDMFMGRTRGAGTPVFMAPEIIRGYQSAQSDQYSLANSYFMLRTGVPVFRGKVAEIRRQHLEAEPQLDTGVLNELEQRVLRKALAKNTADRFATSTEFVKALIAASEGREPDLGSSSTVVQHSATQAEIPASEKVDNDVVPTVQAVKSAKSKDQDRAAMFPAMGEDKHAIESEVPMTIERSRDNPWTQTARRKWEPLKTVSSTSHPKVELRAKPTAESTEVILRFTVIFLGTAALTAAVIFALRIFQLL